MYKLIGSAQGLKGILCKSYGGDGDFLRVYQPEDTNNFVDYYIHHPDIEIEILDDSAYVYQAPNGEHIIDISFEGMDIDGKKERWVVDKCVDGTYVIDSYSKEQDISIKVEGIFYDIEQEIKYAQELADKLNSLE